MMVMLSRVNEVTETMLESAGVYNRTRLAKQCVRL